MRDPIYISTGFLYRIREDFNERISKLKEFLPAGIELTFA